MGIVACSQHNLPTLLCAHVFKWKQSFCWTETTLILCNSTNLTIIPSVTLSDSHSPTGFLFDVCQYLFFAFSFLQRLIRERMPLSKLLELLAPFQLTESPSIGAFTRVGLVYLSIATIALPSVAAVDEIFVSYKGIDIPIYLGSTTNIRCRWRGHCAAQKGYPASRIGWHSGFPFTHRIPITGRGGVPR